jgi:hypothetical protein
MTIDINGTLEKRGLLALATRAGWKPYTLKRDGNEYLGWQYPVFGVDGNAYDRPRWKSAVGTGPRYFWPKGQPDKSKYYFLPGLLTAIQQDSGAVYIAAGEPDVLAYHAAGIENVFCWLSAEISVPDSLVSDLKYMGVSSVIYAPDRDKAGMTAAAKVAAMLDTAEIPYRMAALPGEIGSKNDINTLWIECEFDKAKFFTRLWHFDHTVDDTDLAIYRPAPSKNGSAVKPKPDDIEAEVKRWYRQWTDEIAAALGPAAMTSGGRSFWRCPVSGRHHSGDANPSFRISTDQKPDQPWPVCSCDIQNDPDPWGAVAASVGVDKWQDYKKAKAWHELGIRANERGELVTRPVADDKGVAVVNMRSAYAKVISIFDKDAEPKSKPIEFPYKTLHRFGGFAQWMWTGKMVAVGGISGGGKTLFLRTLFSAMLKAGYDMIWWGPEFSPEEYAYQDLIRAGGLNFNQINQLLVIRALMAQHKISEIEAIKKSGLAMPSQAAIKHSVELLEGLQQSPGELFIIDDPDADVDTTMQIVTGWANARRAEGHEVGGIGWDYLQLANMSGKRDWSWGNRVAGGIKRGCAPRNANITAFVSTQSRKGDSAAVRDNGKLLKVGAAQGLDESFFNLWLTLTPGFLDGTKQPWAILSVEKNSMGGLGRVAVDARWDRLMILDKEAEIDVEGYLSGGMKP